ncbi:hypothetical protein [Streptomyces sp. LN704]|uniref:hypothetical protein n=1 Tax=unclassified Streptomyces TaxID=2593676 RepID=UPI00371C0FDF
MRAADHLERSLPDLLVTLAALSGPAFEPVIGPTVAALTALAPKLVAPGHCTGWRAQHALATALPDAWVPSSSGTTHRLAAV